MDPDTRTAKIPITVMHFQYSFSSEEAAEIWRSVICPDPVRVSQPSKPVEASRTLWIDEAVTYLGLDRTGITRPQRAIHRLIKKGALHPNKISGRLVFDREELDKVLANGDHKRQRGRPRKL